MRQLRKVRVRSDIVGVVRLAHARDAYGGTMNLIDERTTTADEDAAARGALAWVEGEHAALAFLDEYLRVVWTNNEAARLLGLLSDISLRDGVLQLQDQDEHQRFARALRQARAQVTTCIPLRSGEGHLLLRARDISRSGRRLFGVRLALVGADTDAGSYEGLEIAYGLTRAEMRVLVALLGGQAAEQIGRELGIAIGTVRTHIRSIYAKVGVNCREELFARAQPFRV